MTMTPYEQAYTHLAHLSEYNRVEYAAILWAVLLLTQHPALWDRFDLAYELFDDDEVNCWHCGWRGRWEETTEDGDCPECGSSDTHSDMTTHNPLDDPEDRAEDHLDGPSRLYAIWER